MDQQEPGNTCACGCGEPVTAGKRWRRGHASRGEGGGPVPLPPPGDPAWSEDVGIIDIEDTGPSPTRESSLSAGPVEPPSSPHQAGPAPAPPADEPPAHARRDWHAKAPKAAKGKAPRLTAGIRSDIDAKISFALEIPGRVWAARDPVCGTVFVDQRPEISRALTEIVCRSPQLVEWFTGTGGGFIMFLDLGAALLPVLQAVMAHHVYHSAELPEGGQQPDMARYAA